MGGLLYVCVCVCVCVCVRVRVCAHLCLTLCNFMDCSPSGSSVHGISQARVLEWAAMPSSGVSSRPVMEPVSLTSPALEDGFFTSSATWEVLLTPGVWA